MARAALDLLAVRTCPRSSPSGVWRAARHTACSGSGEDCLPSLISADLSYKPMVRSTVGKRESDGVVVMPIAGRKPAGGKAPDFGRAGDSPTSDGTWPGPPGPVSPRASWPPLRLDASRPCYGLQPSDRTVGVSMLSVTASPGTTFLREASRWVRANRGAAGVTR